MSLRKLRKEKKLTQAECARYLGVPLRTYQNYETDPARAGSIKYAFMLQKLEQYGFVDEDHGILTVRQISDICAEIFAAYDVEFCYLFGSYAKASATEKSDVDLLIATPATGMRFYDMVEALRQGLKKKVDVLRAEQLTNNPQLTKEILKDGIKLYG